MNTKDLKETAMSYLASFEARDLAACLDFYHPEATIHFGPGTYAGRKAIEEWHKDRFDAGLRLIRIEKVAQEGETISANVVAISERIKSWGLDTLNATLTLLFDNEKIKEARFSLLEGNPLESWSQ